MSAPAATAPLLTAQRQVAVIRHGVILGGRNLRHAVRIPGRLVVGLVQPVMFVLLFAYVFGGSLGGMPYREFLMPGVFAQTVVFNTSFTTLGLANDLHSGFVDRLRGLPVSPVSLILGRTGADLLITAVTLATTTLCGLAIGWRIHASPSHVAAAYLLALAFSFAMAWVGATVGLIARDVEVAASAGLIWLFPVTLISSAFVSVQAMPAPLRVLAAWNPVSAVAGGMRELLGSPVPPALAPPPGWPAQHAVEYALASTVILLAVFMPVALHRFRRLTQT